VYDLLIRTCFRSSSWKEKTSADGAAAPTSPPPKRLPAARSARVISSNRCWKYSRAS